MLIPIAFVNDHIETLHELDIEYAQDIGKEVNQLDSFNNFFDILFRLEQSVSAAVLLQTVIQPSLSAWLTL